MVQKTDKLRKVKEEILNVLLFLIDYLPLANAHSTDFILLNLWNEFFPKNVQEELSEMTDQQLSELLSLTNYISQSNEESRFPHGDVERTNKLIENGLLKVREKMKTSTYIQSAPVVENVKKLNKMRQIPPDWQHLDVQSFVNDAQKHALDALDIVDSLRDVISRNGCDLKDGESDVFVSKFMSEKKGHEVEILADLCKKLVKNRDVDVVVDVGSGKGYLGSYLSLHYSLPVIGVDSSCSNTSAAGTRADRLQVQWNSLVRNAKAQKLAGKKIKMRKQNRRLKMKNSGKKKTDSLPRNDEIDLSSENDEYIPDTFFSEEFTKVDICDAPMGYEHENHLKDDCQVFSNNVVASTFLKNHSPPTGENDEICVDKVHVAGNREIVPENENLNSEQSENSEINSQNFSPHHSSSCDQCKAGHPSGEDNSVDKTNKGNHIHVQDFSDDVSHKKPINKKCDILDCERVGSSLCEICSTCLEGKQSNLSQDKSKDFTNSKHIPENQDEVLLPKDTVYDDDKGEIGTKGSTGESSSKHKTRHIAVTKFINSSTDLDDIVKDNLEDLEVKNSGDLKLMLTGLHTCGALGSSVLKLFIDNPRVKVLCNVACCYHLMTEEFSRNNYQKDDEPHPSETDFPMSKFLREEKVVIGMNARNLASQSLHRMRTELLGKACFPRTLLQVITNDVLGYVSDDWKGLRRLNQKTSDLFEYVSKAFEKLGLPREKISRELVNGYQDKYQEYEKRLAAFYQMKAVLAPAVESLVLLDRLCYLLEQEVVKDAHLVKLFDPVTSPRCYGIIATK